ncbi:abnormal spindle-like microcephaly-associated protein homolog [Xenia sp. Carnegie-2017]|uniref:abnormal spindle-like microcephaly-associated protein homolog n=1 Tax=Xenia sp. Carnegie-2017 TaxID=2897299 RepID=UPI001F04108F|nr:abnormal spindle-like microcephaly-associated protein homolog [Xenia sp. Carnegie-2017]
MKKAAACIQQHYRALKTGEEKRHRFLVVKRFATKTHINLMAIRLQRAYRKAMAIALLKAKIDSVVIVQRWWRAKLQRKFYLRTLHFIRLLQKKWRTRLTIMHQSATRIQAVVRCFLARRFARKKMKAIINIQRTWRDYNVRKRFNSKKFRKLRERIIVANSDVTESMKLCNRTRSALDYLLNCKNLTTVREALVHLEVATRWTFKCSQQQVENNALRVIFQIIRDSNRSLAHMGLIKLALDIFTNVSKCPATQDAVVLKEENALETILELACIFREKKEIFLRVAKLLTILCTHENVRKKLLKTENAAMKISSIYSITKRKFEIEMKRNTKMKQQNGKGGRYKTDNIYGDALTAVITLMETIGLDYPV